MSTGSDKQFQASTFCLLFGEQCEWKYSARNIHLLNVCLRRWDRSNFKKMFSFFYNLRYCQALLWELLQYTLYTGLFHERNLSPGFVDLTLVLGLCLSCIVYNDPAKLRKPAPHLPVMACLIYEHRHRGIYVALKLIQCSLTISGPTRSRGVVTFCLCCSQAALGGHVS